MRNLFGDQPAAAIAGALSCAIVSLALISACQTSDVAAGATTLSAEDQRHIAEIENGLLPPVTIKGRPLPVQNLTARMQATNTPAVSIAFFEDGRIRWAKAYGFADVASHRPATPETLFQAASISKPLSAVAAMRLVQDGKLKLDEDVNVGLKTWKLPPSKFTAERKVTLRGLLSHTAGLTVPGDGFHGYQPGKPIPTIIQILNGEPPSNTSAVLSDAAPGEHWLYSGGGYVVAELLMTDATGEAFPDLMRRLVLQPAGMKHSTFEQSLPEALHDQAATGYFVDGKPLPGGSWINPELAPAGLWTTPSDLARFAIALQDAYTGASDKLLNKATAQLMLTRTMNDFGLGVNLGRPADAPMFQHGGGNQGFKNELRAFTGGRRQGVVIMTNGDGGLALMPEILRAVAQTYDWKGMGPEQRTVLQLDGAVLSAYAGVYEAPGVTTLTVTTGDGRLYAVASALGPDRRELLALTPTSFFMLENGVTVDFARDAAGAVAAAQIGGPYGQFVATRRPPVQ